MNRLNRRTFLKTSALALGAGLGARLAAPAWARPLGANDAIRVAVVGINNQGASHIRQLLKTSGVRLAALCDVDPRVLAREVEDLQTKQVNVFATADARELMGRADIDAVIIATSNHWHALLTVWACQAGKDVYVEKPVSHTVWEGRKMIEAVAKYGRIVQAGTQFRSDTGIPELIQYLKEGHLGKIRWIHTPSYKLRESIGRRLPWYPDWLNYDLFCGSTPMAPLERANLHYDWHWMWDTGNGDLGNLGIHLLDIARRIAGHEAPPRRILSLGGRFAVDDAGETPNTQLTVFDYPGLPLFFEGRGLPAKPGVKYLDQFRNIREGVVVQCEGGYYAGYMGGAAYDNNGKQIKTFAGDGGEGHLGNFLAAVRSRRAQDLAAPIQTGHDSTSITHYGNISYRVGQPAGLAQAREAIESIPGTQETLERIQQHLAVHGVDLDQPRLTLGRWVQLEPARDGITRVEGGDEPALERARYLLKGVQRAPYAIPEQV